MKYHNEIKSRFHSLKKLLNYWYRRLHHIFVFCEYIFIIERLSLRLLFFFIHNRSKWRRLPDVAWCRWIVSLHWRSASRKPSYCSCKVALYTYSKSRYLETLFVFYGNDFKKMWIYRKIACCSKIYAWFTRFTTQNIHWSKKLNKWINK